MYGVGESDSNRLSTSFGLTFCAFIGACAAGAIFLWDKIHASKKIGQNAGFRGLSGIPSSRPGHRRVGSRVSHVRTSGSQLSAPSIAKSTRAGANQSTTQLPPSKET